MAGTIKVQVLKDEGFTRILRCSEGNRIWYQLWIDPYLMGYIKMHYGRFIENGVIKAWWLRNVEQQYYVFFYEKKGGKVRGVLGKGNTIKLLGGIV